MRLCECECVCVCACVCVCVRCLLCCAVVVVSSTSSADVFGSVGEYANLVGRRALADHRVAVEYWHTTRVRFLVGLCVGSVREELRAYIEYLHARLRDPAGGQGSRRHLDLDTFLRVYLYREEF